MPTSTTALATLRPDLASSFMEFDLSMGRQGFIASRVAPVVEVAKQAGNFGKIPVESLLSKRDTLRSPGGSYSSQDWDFDDAPFSCEEHGAVEAVDDRTATMYAEYFDAELMAAARARDVVLRNYEARVEAAIFNATTWSGSALTTEVTNEWDDAANATPVTDVEAAVQRVYDNSGLIANALIIGWKVFRNLRLVTTANQIIDRLKYSGVDDPKAGNMSAAMLAACFGLDYVIVGGAVENTANEGQSASLSMIWSGEYAMVCRVAETDDPREPCIARTFHWSEDGSSIGTTLESYREESRRSDMIRARMDVDEVVMYAEAGHLLSNITT